MHGSLLHAFDKAFPSITDVLILKMMGIQWAMHSSLTIHYGLVMLYTDSAKSMCLLLLSIADHIRFV